MGWFVKKKMKIQRGPSIVTVLAGEPVPEAEHWRTRGALERQGYIEWKDETVPLSPVTVTETKEEAMDVDAPSLTEKKRTKRKPRKPGSKKKVKNK